MGLMDAIREDEAKLKKINAEGDDTDDGADDGADDAPAKGKNGAAADDDADGDDEGDAAPGKKVDPKAKATKKDADDGDDGDDEAGDDKKAKDGKGESDNSVAAQLRIANKQQKQQEKRISDLMAELEAARKPAAPAAAPVKADGDDAAKPKEPTAEERLEKIERERENQRLEAAAVEEFTTYENEFQAETPDYPQASNHMIQSMAAAVKGMYPNATQKQIGVFVKGQILNLAAQAVKNGLNPAEALYKMSLSHYGYKPGQKQQAKPNVDETKKRLERSADTRKRSANGLGGGGQHSNPGATIEEAAKMSLADFSKLKPGEIDALIAEGAEG